MKGDESDCPSPLLDIGRMDRQSDQVPLDVGDDMVLAAFDLLASVVPRKPTRSVVVAKLSMKPALGLASRPRARRAAATRWKL